LDLREHLNPEGLQKIVNLRASVNNGLSDSLKAAFPNTQPVSRPIVEFKGIPDPNWFVGFFAEGCFMVKVRESKTHKIGSQVSVDFSITQNPRDCVLFKNFQQYLDCGSTHVHSDQTAVTFFVRKGH